MNIYIFSLLIASILSLVLWFYLMLNRESKGGIILLGLVGAVTSWSFLYAVEIGVDSLSGMMLIAKIEYLAILSVPALWLIFALEYSEISNQYYPKLRNIIFILPVIVLVFVWTNELHHLYWSANSIQEYGGAVYLVLEHGPVYWIYSIYAYMLTLAGSGLLICKALRSNSDRLASSMLLSIGAFIPLLTNIISIAGWLPNQNFDLTPIGLAIGMIVLAVGIFQYKILKVIPKAQNLIFSHWKDAFLILDNQGEVLEFNATVLDLAFIEQEPAKGKLFSQINEVLEFIINPGNQGESLHLPAWQFVRDNLKFIYEIQVWPIEENAHNLGWMVGIRDVTQSILLKESMIWREKFLTRVHQAEIEFLQSSELGLGMKEFLRELGDGTKSNHVYLYQHSIGEGLESKFSPTSEWFLSEKVTNYLPPFFQVFSDQPGVFGDWTMTTGQGELSVFRAIGLEDEVQEVFHNADVDMSITIPVFVENQWWGVLGFDYGESTVSISDNEAEVLFSAANAIGAALNRSQIYDEMEHKAGFLTFLSHLSLEGNRDQSSEVLRKNLTVLLKEFSQADNLLILTKSVIEGVERVDIPNEILNLYQRLEENNLPVSLTPVDDEFPEGFSDFKAVIGFPVVSASEFLGVVILFFVEYKALQSEEIEEYLQVISQIGLILARSQSVANLEEHVLLRTAAYEEANRALKKEMQEREKIARTLNENQAMYRGLFDNSPDPIFILDQKGNHVNVNQKAADLLGYTIDELVGSHRNKIVLEEENKKSDLVLKGLLEGKDFQSFPRTFVHKSGTKIPMEINVSTIHDKGGKGVLIQKVARDVSARNASDTRIELQFKRLSSLRKIDRMVAENLDIYLTLDILVREVIDQLDVDAANVLLLNKASGKLEFESGYGFNHTSIQKSQIALGEGMLGQAAQDRQMLRYVRSELADFKFERFTQNPEENFESYFAFPLEVQGQIQGVLEVYHRKMLNPTEEWMDFLETLAAQAAIAIDNSYLFTDLEKTNKELEQAYVSTLEGWARALDLRDNETAGHTERVTDLTVSLGSLMGLNPEELVNLKRGAILHDIGKMGVPDAVLLKPGKLDAEERKIIEQHPQYAYDMLSQIDFLIPSLDIPYGHHEKWDGTGYPRQLEGEEIPLGARIFCIVDVWDALTSDRPYRKAWPTQKTFDYIQELSGTHFEPQVVQSFSELLEYTTDFDIDWDAFHSEGEE